MSKDFKTQILINYTLFTRLTDTPIIRPDSVVALNPNNRDHQQGNMCFNIHLQDNVATFTEEVNALFKQAGCQPRYHIDCFASPSIDTLCEAFTALGYQVERDLDIVMSCDYKSIYRDTRMLPPGYRSAHRSDLEALVRVFFEANHYPGTDDWLRKKLTKQMDDPTAFRLFVMEVEGEVVCGVILFTPPGLPHLGHVSGVATLPEHQRKGLAAGCLKQALMETCCPDQRFYLDSYDDLVHAHRMYEKIGFQSHGFMETAVATLRQEE